MARLQRCTKVTYLCVGVGLRTATLQDHHLVDFGMVEMLFEIIRNVKMEIKSLNVITEKENIVQ